MSTTIRNPLDKIRKIVYNFAQRRMERGERMEPKDIARRFVEQYQGKRDPAAFAEYLSPDVIDHSPMPGTAGGAEGIRQVFEMLWAGLPDMRVEIHDQIAEGDRVATRKSFVGTQDGELFGVPPTGRDVHVDLIDIVRVVGGRIVEHWNIVDTYGLMQQLGAL
jgi:predicted ester cyclase